MGIYNQPEKFRQKRIHIKQNRTGGLFFLCRDVFVGPFLSGKKEEKMCYAICLSFGATRFVRCVRRMLCCLLSCSRLDRESSSTTPSLLTDQNTLKRGSRRRATSVREHDPKINIRCSSDSETDQYRLRKSWSWHLYSSLLPSDMSQVRSLSFLQNFLFQIWNQLFIYLFFHLFIFVFNF